MHIRKWLQKTMCGHSPLIFSAVGPVVKSESCADGVKERQTMQSFSQ